MFGTISFYLPSLAFFLNHCLVISSNCFYFDSMNTLWLLLLLLFLLLLLLLLLSLLLSSSSSSSSSSSIFLKLTEVVTLFTYHLFLQHNEAN